MNGRLTPTRLSRKAITAFGGALLVIAAITGVVSATVVVGPRATASILERDLQFRLGAVGPSTLDLQSSSAVGYNFAEQRDNSALLAVKAMPSTLIAARQAMPADLRAITGPGRYIATSAGVAGHGIVASGPPQQKPRSRYEYSVEANPQLRSDAVLVAGSWPSPVTKFSNTRAIELVTTASAATTLGWKIGQRQQLALLGTDLTQAVVLVGTVRPRDPGTDYWQLDASRARANVTTAIDGDDPTYFGTVWMDANSWPRVSDGLTGPTLRAWYPVIRARVTPNAIGALTADLHRFASQPRSVGGGSQSVQLRFGSQLEPELDSYLESASAASAIITVIEAGPIGTGAALVLLAILSLVDRRRPVVDLMRARGGSKNQVRLESATLIAVATIPGALGGVAIAIALTGGAVTGSAVLAAAMLALVPPVVAGLATGGSIVILDKAGVARMPRWRWALDALLLLVAILDLTILLGRGSGSAASSVGADPLLAITPLVVSAAACALALRAMPTALRRLAKVIGRGRGVVGLVGRANSARAGARFLPVFAILTGVSIALFAATILTTERAGIQSAAVTRVGADISISGEPISSGTVRRLTALRGTSGVATVYYLGAVSLMGHHDNAAVYAVNARDLAAVEATLPPASQLFYGLGSIHGGRSLAIAGGFQPPLDAQSSLAGSPSSTVATRETDRDPPAWIGGSHWLVMDSAAAPPSLRAEKEVSAVLIRVGTGTDENSLVRQVRATVGPRATVSVASDTIRALTSTPLVGGLENLALATVIVSFALAIFAVLLALVMGARERRTLLGRLRALGFSARQSSSLIAWEVGPMSVLGILAGVIVGTTLPLVFLSVVDLSAFSGSAEAPPLVLDPLIVVATVLAFVASALVAVAITASVSARQPLSNPIREVGQK